MSSYFDEANTRVREMFEAEEPGTLVSEIFWAAYHVFENRIVEETIKACRARGFPQELRAKIFKIVELRRVFKTSQQTTRHPRNAADLTMMHSSFLVSELHSVFHLVATEGHRSKRPWLCDDPGYMARKAPLEKGLSR